MQSLIHISVAMLQILIGYNLILPVVLYIVYLVKIKTNAPRHLVSNNKVMPDYGIIVTAFMDPSNLPFVVDSILKMNYQKYMVYIVADCCEMDRLKFNDERVIVLTPDSPLKSNVKSHFYAINHFKRAHERLTIIDSDNLVHPEYLNELNKSFDQGYSAVQGVRTAKNLNTNYACLDAARDIYYHFFDGKIIFNIGSSATLAGSGMAFNTELYKKCLVEHLDMVGAGFDKILQSELVARDFQIAFAEKAIVYDEKTTKPDQLVKQRARWINTWFKYFKYGFDLIEKGIAKRNKNQFLFGIILLRPPLFIFLLLSLGCLIINLLVNPYYSLIWLVGFILFIAGFLIALYKSDTNPKIYASLSNIPKFMFYQVISLLRSNRVNKGPITTKHYSNVSINDKIG